MRFLLVAKGLFSMTCMAPVGDMVFMMDAMDAVWTSCERKKTSSIAWMSEPSTVD